VRGTLNLQGRARIIRFVVMTFLWQSHSIQNAASRILCDPFVVFLAAFVIYPFNRIIKIYCHPYNQCMQNIGSVMNSSHSEVIRISEKQVRFVALTFLWLSHSIPNTASRISCDPFVVFLAVFVIYPFNRIIIKYIAIHIINVCKTLGQS
jgi:hypothetical protein